MTHEEIYQGNLEIAKMLGIEIIEAYPPNKETKQDGLLFKLDKDFAQSVNSVFLHVSTLKFHCDWNWLKQALLFIESNWYTYTITPNNCIIKHLWDNNIHIESGGNDSVYKCVKMFAELYNKGEHD